jgi:hypothetical protein
MDICRKLGIYLSSNFNLAFSHQGSSLLSKCGGGCGHFKNLLLVGAAAFYLYKKNSKVHLGMTGVIT